MTTLQEQVLKFMATFRHPVGHKPNTPPRPRVMLRAKLIAEEAIESVEAMCGHPSQTVFTRALDAMATVSIMRAIEKYHPKDKPLTLFAAAYALLMAAIAETTEAPLSLAQMVEVVNRMADLDYVSEGARLEYGVNGGPIAVIVHDANMAKVGATNREDDKTLKPEGWVAPDEAIAAELVRQGYLAA